MTSAERAVMVSGSSAIDVNAAVLVGDLVEAPQRQRVADALLALRDALLPAETRLNLRAVDFYDCIDLLQDAAAAIRNGQTDVASDLGDPLEPAR